MVTATVGSNCHFDRNFGNRGTKATVQFGLSQKAEMIATKCHCQSRPQLTNFSRRVALRHETDWTPPSCKCGSFDIFDTLIARICTDPHEIFSIVGHISGLSDFSILRKRAESLMRPIAVHASLVSKKHYFLR